MEGINFPLYFNNNGVLEANINAAGQWVALVFCHVATGFCDTIIVENPCFGSSNNCVLNISSVALENASNSVNAALRITKENNCTSNFSLRVNNDEIDSLFVEDDYIFAKGLPIDVPSYHFELCNIDSQIVCTDTTVINPRYIVSSQDESPSFTIACQNNTIFVETSVAMHLTLWDMYGRKLEEWAIMEKTITRSLQGCLQDLWW